MLRIAAVACIVACAYPRAGGAPGPPSVRCRAGDGTCELVAGALEARRANIGAGCVEHAPLRASAVVALQGEPALPYLEHAFDDRDPEVALLAMSTAIVIGDRRAVERWCSDISDRFRIEMCRNAEATDLEHVHRRENTLECQPAI